MKLSIMLGLASIVLVSGVAICSTNISEEGLEEYIRRYLQEYRVLFETYENDLGNLSEFSFYSGFPYYVKGVISNTHGAAIFFYSSSKEEIEIQTTEERIEFYLWPVMKDNPPTTFWETENNEESSGFVSYYITANLQVGDGVTPTFVHHQRSEIVIFASSEIQYDYRIIVKPLGHLKIDGILIYENRMILKGSNDEQNWLPEVALLDATNEFLRLVRKAVLDEAETKQIQGFSLLKAKAEQIERRLADGTYEDNWRLRWKDEEEFWQIVKDYGIKEELARGILDGILKPYLEPNPNPVLEIIKLVVILIIAPVMAGLIIAWLTGKWKPKFFRSKRRKLKKPRAQATYNCNFL